jgi:hypothetical protein
MKRDFSEEEAAGVLHRMGFDIITVDDLQLVGYRVVDREDTFGDWAVEQIDYHVPSDRELHMTLLTKFSGPMQATLGLVEYLAKQRWTS